ncbi:SET domain-containing protein [Aureispira sp. CCB-E]|uniref:SET domain-containing protein n=1 Tax=Aureispira sp. CCB-E TaxID=3051121 RepID=UPI0028684AB3|nr:SET domain-containing protein [Aureispira sp. CCB-E]WMX13633.1 SET domain-containing protein [Aureispira sp. CCB-E]
MSQQIPHIFVAHSKLHGRGVFTGVPISSGSIIEICPILYLPKEDIPALQGTIINDYYFEWDEDLQAGALALGYGSIYNHSFTCNATYQVDMDADVLYIHALRDIVAGEEITINYNGNPEDDSPLWFDTK